MLAQFRYAIRHDPPHFRILAWRFSTNIRRKRRQYKQVQTPWGLCSSPSTSTHQTQVLLAEAESSESCKRCLACRPGHPFSLSLHRSSALLQQSIRSIQSTPVPPASLQALPWMLTSLSKSLSWPCQSFPMAKLLVGLAGLLSCRNMLQIMSSWSMADATRSGS